MSGIVHMLVQSLFCAINSMLPICSPHSMLPICSPHFMLPICSPHSAEVSRATCKVDQAWPVEGSAVNWSLLIDKIGKEIKV